MASSQGRRRSRGRRAFCDLRRVVSIAPVLLPCALLALGCASGGSDSKLAREIVGTWVNERAQKDSKGIVDHVSTRSSPYPYRVVLRANGSFEALYTPKQLARVQRALGSDSLVSPLAGRYELTVDWLGVAWIDMRPGPPRRRISVKGDRLVLHKVGQSWTAEKYRRER